MLAVKYRLTCVYLLFIDDGYYNITNKTWGVLVTKYIHKYILNAYMVYKWKLIDVSMFSTLNQSGRTLDEMQSGVLIH